MKKSYELKEILLESISFGERVRDPKRDLFLMKFVQEELIPSIKERGLITPICVKTQEGGDKPYLLLAGGNRLRAFELMGKTSIPALVFNDYLTDLEIALIEEAENLKRRDFSPAEKAASYAKIHTLLQQQHGVALPGRSGAEGWTIEKTANLLNKSTGQVSTMLKLHDMFVKNPQAKSLFKTTSEAYAFLKKAETSARHSIQAERILSNPNKGKLKVQSAYLLGDFFKASKEIDSGLFDLIEADPPYSINLNELRKNGENSTAGYNEVEEEEYPSFLQLLIDECWRLLKPNGWLIFWFAPDPWQEVILNKLRNRGFSVRNIPAIWKKGHVDESGETVGGGMQTKTPAYYLARSYESFFYARKGNARIVRQGRPDCFEFQNIPAQKRIHPTEKPIDLMKSLLETFAEPGSNILVPFAGSGNTLLAAFSIGMKAVGFDISENYRNSFVVRVNEMEKLQ